MTHGYRHSAACASLRPDVASVTMAGFARGSRRLLRTLIVVAGTLLATLPAESQPARSVPRAGYLSPATQQNPAGVVATNAFLQGLHELGYVEGRTIVIERRNADGKLDRLSALADELVRLNVDVILAGGSPSAVPHKLGVHETGAGP